MTAQITSVSFWCQKQEKSIDLSGQHINAGICGAYFKFHVEEQNVKAIGKKLIHIFQKETVLCIAAFLAVISMFLMPPDSAYSEYIDYGVLAILFSLMVVMEGLRVAGIFDTIARFMLSKADNLRKLAFVMVFLCFFSAMFITNDVALITFVPFTLLMLSMAGLTEQTIVIVVLETIAANLGSMLTPVGNPQNLYLYTVSGMNIGDFLKVTFPITLVSGLLLLICCFFLKKKSVSMAQSEQTESKVENFGTHQSAQAKKGTKTLFFYLLFAVALLSVLRVIPVWIPCLIALLGTLMVQPKVLLKVDYCLLLTFVSFFVFIGNIGRVDVVRMWLESLLSGRELIISFLASQVISNVPAAVLLAEFTTEYGELIRGVNIGGLGTLIASLASVISYKFFSQELPQKKGKYFVYFTLFNILFAIVLLGFVAIAKML